VNDLHTKCRCHPSISCFVKIHNGLCFWCQLIQAVLNEEALKWLLYYYFIVGCIKMFSTREGTSCDIIQDNRQLNKIYSICYNKSRHMYMAT